MSTTSSPAGGVIDPVGPTANRDPRLAEIKDAATESMDFMLWTSAQATSLAKLKVFHTMAKQINDQQ